MNNFFNLGVDFLVKIMYTLCIESERNKPKEREKKMSISREDMIWEAELAAEDLEGLSEDKLGKLENMARDNEESDCE